MFGIFNLAYPKIVDPAIFVWESFIFAGNFLARRAGARRALFLRPSPPILSCVAAWFRSSRSNRGNSPRVHRGIQVTRKKEGGVQKKEAARGGKKIVARGEESFRGKLPRRGEYGHDKKSKILGISKLPSNCAYAKMSSLVHQMSSVPKCISQMQNCWRAIFKVFDKFKECKVQLHNCWRCSY